MPDQRQTDEEPESVDVASMDAKLPKIISFSKLAPCGGEIWIENNGQLYRLRQTSQGKLILTK